MGKPAARCGDTVMTCNDPADMPVGTIIAVGTVMINSMPAAKQNDQVVGTDIHIIMNPSPGGPVPTPTPHPFVGMLDNGLSTTVNIMGMPAAVVGSEASCMPPHIPIGAGPFQKPPTNKGKVMMGSPTVMIGDGSGGGGGGGSGSSATATQVQVAATHEAEGHFLKIKFVDKGGKPITGVGFTLTSPDNETTGGVLGGKLDQTVPAEGNYEIALKAITKAGWSESQARVGDKVKLQVEAVGIESGTDAQLEIFIRDVNFPDTPFKMIESKIEGGKIEEEWEMEIDEDLLKDQDSRAEKGGFSAPSFLFKVSVDGLTQKSSLLSYKDYIELKLKDEAGEQIKNVKYLVRLPSGGLKDGYLDGDGYAKVDGLPPGKVEVGFDTSDVKK